MHTFAARIRELRSQTLSDPPSQIYQLEQLPWSHRSWQCKLHLQVLVPAVLRAVVRRARRQIPFGQNSAPQMDTASRCCGRLRSERSELKLPQHWDATAYRYVRAESFAQVAPRTTQQPHVVVSVIPPGKAFKSRSHCRILPLESKDISKGTNGIVTPAVRAFVHVVHTRGCPFSFA
ncbi:hypothetical protein BC835DRAFT_402950 [Cytidiella melzeri]|nr:hypothetical protein BC835DRAFT_402950 [Cytidiella melzeri]